MPLAKGSGQSEAVLKALVACALVERAEAPRPACQPENLAPSGPPAVGDERGSERRPPGSAWVGGSQRPSPRRPGGGVGRAGQSCSGVPVREWPDFGDFHLIVTWRAPDLGQKISDRGRVKGRRQISMSPTRCDRPARARGMQHAVKSGVQVPAAQLSPSCLRVPVLRPGGYFYFKFYRT